MAARENDVLKGFEPPKTTACAKCGKSPSRYYGNWGEEGFCRACIEGMVPESRLRILREMNPADRKRWQLDSLSRMSPLDRKGASGGVRRGADAWTAPAAGPLHASSAGSAHLASKPERSERRQHPRYSAKLPVGLSVSGSAAASGSTRPMMFHALSRDISAGGIRVSAPDPGLLALPVGCRCRVEVLLPRPSEILRCTAVVKNVVRGRQSSELGSVGLMFQDIAPTQEATLQRFLGIESGRHAP